MKKALTLVLALCVVFVSSLLVVRSGLDEEMQIYENTLRLHIPANSDSESDQRLKLAVRDSVIMLLEKPLSECKTKDEAVNIVQNMTKEIALTANNTIKEQGSDYIARVTLTKEEYPEKCYGELTLPAGEYTSLKIELGNADGQNWWCVLFPQVCTGSARPTEALAQVGFTPSQIKLLTSRDDYEYVVKFKLLEVVEKIFG